MKSSTRRVRLRVFADTYGENIAWLHDCTDFLHERNAFHDRVQLPSHTLDKTIIENFSIPLAKSFLNLPRNLLPALWASYVGMNNIHSDARFMIDMIAGKRKFFVVYYGQQTNGAVCHLKRFFRGNNLCATGLYTFF